MRIPKNRDTEKAARVKKVSRITGVSERQVYRVLSGDRENEFVFDMYMALVEEEQKMENELLDAVKELVPFK